MPLPKRGRPNSQEVRLMQAQQSNSNARHRCSICKRGFFRKKGLNTHVRTHTGETPYVCTFPQCRRAFKQSGQLKTHEKRHTGALPFKCLSLGCSERFRHHNRKCSVHIKAGVESDGKFGWEKIPKDLTPEQREWIVQLSSSDTHSSDPFIPYSRDVCEDVDWGAWYLHSFRTGVPIPESVIQGVKKFLKL